MLMASKIRNTRKKFETGKYIVHIQIDFLCYVDVLQNQFSN